MTQLFVAIAACIVAGDGAKNVIERREASFCNLVPFRENRRYAFLDAPATLRRRDDATVELACGNATTISDSVSYAWFRLGVDANGSVVELNDSRRTIRIGAVDFQTTVYYECRYDKTSEGVRRDFFYFVQSHPSYVHVDCRTNSLLGLQHWFNRDQVGDDVWTDYSYFSREINACRAIGGVEKRRPCVNDIVQRARNIYALPLVIPVRRNENASTFVCSYSSTWPRRVVDLSCWSVKVSVLEHVEMDVITPEKSTELTNAVSPNGTAAAAPNGTAAATPNGTAPATATDTYTVKSTPVSTLASEAGVPVSVIGVAVGLFCLGAVVILFAVRLKRRAKWEQKGKSALGAITIENKKVGSESAI
ncbi:uncharacterized protein [Oscarella lobularis]|uniref:uncharacterized protein isoform X2 n=1 Tax=Oscarella lobularis TaxID=121494 RepID=UPI0033136604